MTTITHGGPAFPVPLHPGQSYQGHAPCDGMTLRDFFAAKAMQAFLSGHITHYGHERHWPYAEMASEAFDVADAMLAARGAQ
ncbi:hypothetical protein [Achromobacter sp. K91]|uniref:hypothetical protein n=1 Tax=Achromobacter sp. K91 TaxID=2292262 RepID=UPI0011C3864D|nr:hypothetical protein [Achromobacter sp. K91]